MNRREFLAASAAVALAPVAAAEAVAKAPQQFPTINLNTGEVGLQTFTGGWVKTIHIGTTWADNKAPILKELLALDKKFQKLYGPARPLTP